MGLTKVKHRAVKRGLLAVEAGSRGTAVQHLNVDDFNELATLERRRQDAKQHRDLLYELNGHHGRA